VIAELADQKELLVGVNQAINQVESRLSMILTPLGPSTESAKSPMQGNPNAVGLVQESNAFLRHLIARLDDLGQRIEL
jgi:hypothetical protein